MSENDKWMGHFQLIFEDHKQSKNQVKKDKF